MNPDLNRDEWLLLRKKYIGASDAAIIMNGRHFDKTPLMLWKEKLSKNVPIVDNFAMKKGRALEETARQKYERKTNNLVFPKIIFHPVKKFMMATLDGLSIDRTCGVEIKCPGEKDHNCALSNKVPKKYYPQLQHQLACANLESIDYFSYYMKEGVLLKVNRDEKYINLLYEKEEEFWNYVETCEPPPETDYDPKKISCKKRFLLGKKYFAIKETIHNLKIQEEQTKNALIDLYSEKSSVGDGIKIIKSTRKGAIIYKDISELRSLDLDKYRKAPSIIYTISKEQDN